MKILALAAIVFALCLPSGVRRQTQLRKQKIRRKAERLGIWDLFD